MTQYEKPSFTVPTGSRDPKTCEHGFLDVRGRCAFCGAPVETARRDTKARCASRCP